MDISNGAIMKTTEYIENKINKLPKGFVFTYLNFITDVTQREAVIKTLNRMAASGRITKLSKGKYYKPEETAFGTLLPDQSQIVKDLLESDGKITGYLTGYSVYSQLGLTTQISSIIQIGKNETRPALTIGRYKIQFIRQKNIITRENIPFLRILDAIRYIRKIPGSTIESSCRRILAIITAMTDSEMKTIVRLAQKYPPSVRALLGALLETSGNETLAGNLKKSLNPITVYKFPGTNSLIPSKGNWYIK